MVSPKRLTLVWLLLLGATALSWAFGHGAMFVTPLNAGTAIVLIAFFKIRVVILEFMEIRHAPALMRIACEAWVLGICAGVVVLSR